MNCLAVLLKQVQRLGRELNICKQSKERARRCKDNFLGREITIVLKECRTVKIRQILNFVARVKRLRHDKNYWIVFLAKYFFISKKYANYQVPLKSPFHPLFH